MAVFLGETDVARVIAVTVNGSQRMHCARSDRDAPLQPSAVSTLGRGGGLRVHYPATHTADDVHQAPIK